MSIFFSFGKVSCGPDEYQGRTAFNEKVASFFLSAQLIG